MGSGILPWAISVIVGTVAVIGWLDARYEILGASRAGLIIMLNELQGDQAADRYWLDQKEKAEGLTDYEMGRKASLEASIESIERQKEALEQ